MPAEPAPSLWEIVLSLLAVLVPLLVAWWLIARGCDRRD